MKNKPTAVDFHGPHTLRFKDDNKTWERPCYYVVGFVSGVYTIFCPDFKTYDALNRPITYTAEWSLAKEKEEGVFVPWGGKEMFLSV